jgi:hypothetical protein
MNTTRDKLLAAIRRMTDRELMQALANTNSVGAWRQALRDEVTRRGLAMPQRVYRDGAWVWAVS